MYVCMYVLRISISRWEPGVSVTLRICSDSAAPCDSAEDCEDMEAGVHLFTDDEEEVRAENNFTGQDWRYLCLLVSIDQPGFQKCLAFVRQGNLGFTFPSPQDSAAFSNWNMEVPASARALDVSRWLRDIGFARLVP